MTEDLVPDPEIQTPADFQKDVRDKGLKELISPKEIEAIERAKRLGTLGKIDRRAQYSGPERARPEALLEAVNAQGNHIRGLQSDTGKLQRDLYNLKLRNTVIVAVVTGLIARGPEILAFVLRFF